jgi:hypothetical protein
MGIDSTEKRRERAELRALAKPQSGVDDLQGRFAGPTKDIPGVVDRQGAQAAAPSR